MSHFKLPLGRCRYTGGVSAPGCRSYTVACRAAVGHLADSIGLCRLKDWMGFIPNEWGSGSGAWLGLGCMNPLSPKSYEYPSVMRTGFHDSAAILQPLKNFRRRLKKREWAPDMGTKPLKALRGYRATNWGSTCPNRGSKAF